MQMIHPWAVVCDYQEVVMVDKKNEALENFSSGLADFLGRCNTQSSDWPKVLISLLFPNLLCNPYCTCILKTMH
jgi:hypothetical protein